jgi:ubiquinone biosynthesis protein Coq4
MDRVQIQAGGPMQAAPSDEPLTKDGLNGEESLYFTGGMKPAEPSVINTSSKYLNNPYYRDIFAQLGLRRQGRDLPTTYIIPMAAKALGEVTDYADFAQRLEEEKTRNHEFAEWLAARRHTVFRAEDLKDCKPGTLGHAIWDFIVSTGYQMDKMQLGDVEATNDIDYISQRRAIVHDLEHLITGFGTNQAGEMGLLWASITAYTRYFSPELGQHIAAGQTMLVNTTMQQTSLHYPAAFPTFLEAARAGIAMGQALKRPLMMENWEDMLDVQIEDIARNLGITRGPGKDWDWTTEATMG